MNIFDKWKQIPKSVKIFLLKGLAIFIIWKSVYLVFLLPGRILDGPLTYSVGAGTAKTLNFLTNSQAFSAKSGVKFEGEGRKLTEIQVMEIYAQQERALSIADVCNGLELIVLYAGFIMCFPSGALRKTIFILTGTILIYIFNVLRCASLILIYLHYPGYLDFSHHYLFTSLVYGFIFLLWYIFTQKLTLTNVQTEL